MEGTGRGGNEGRGDMMEEAGGGKRVVQWEQEKSLFDRAKTVGPVGAWCVPAG